MSKKNLFIFLVISILAVFIANFFISKNYNKPENVEKRAVKYCIDNNHEYREVSDSDGKRLKQCKIN